MTRPRIFTILAPTFAMVGATAAGALPTTAPPPSGDPAMTGQQAARPPAPPHATRIVGPGNGSPAQDEQRARGLVRIGEVGIARENDAALDAYFAKNFAFHGPGGDMTYDQLKASFASMRAAFSEFAVTRELIIVKGDMVSARTTMTGVFTRPFSVPPYGVLPPTGKRFKRELINIFRYDADGKLAEEWAQSDSLGFLKQLGLKLQPAD